MNEVRSYGSLKHVKDASVRMERARRSLLRFQEPLADAVTCPIISFSSFLFISLVFDGCGCGCLGKERDREWKEMRVFNCVHGGEDVKQLFVHAVIGELSWARKQSDQKQN